MRIMKKGIALLLAVIILAACATTALAVSDQALGAAIEDTAAYIYSTVRNPQVGSIGGEWTIVGLARSGYDIPEQYYQNYYAALESYVRDCEGNLHEKKYTEYSRVILALTAIGKDPANVAGYNLLTPLGDYDKTIWQGLNGPVWALVALDSGGYPMPRSPGAKTQATRAMYVDRILACQLRDGGFSLFGGTEAAAAGDQAADPDITGMALQALAQYQDRADVKKVINEALDCMSREQDSKGGFSSWGTANSESVAQMIVALTELGVPLDDPRFVKNGCTLLDNLMTFYVPEKGFRHTADGSGSSQMATEQAFYALAAVERVRDGKNSLYRMEDALKIGGTGDGGLKAGQGLKGKKPEVEARPVVYPGKTFTDISAHENRPAIETLASRGIISGKTDILFEPDATMTRAEFAAVVVRGLGLTARTDDTFTDVPATGWYAGYVGTASNYGIITGKTAAAFDPSGAITRQEAAAMIARAAKLCGMDTALDGGAVRDMLAQFTDYVQVDAWAREAVAFCYSEDILPQRELDIRPKEPIRRCEIAQMLFNMLEDANLLQ